MSGSALDNNLSHPSVSTPVDTEMHKEDLQAPGNPTSLGVPSEEGANPQLNSGCDVSTDSTAEFDPGLSAPNDSMPHQQGTNKELGADTTSTKIKLEDRSQFMHDTRSTFLASDSPTDEPIISQKDKLEQQKAKARAEVASLKARPSYPDINQLTKLLGMEIELPGNFKYLPTKLETFTSTISSITSQVAKPKTLQWELPAEFLALPSQISLVQVKLHTLDTLPSLLNKVANTLTRFASIMENASPKAKSKGVPSAGQATASPAKGETNINPATKDAEKQTCTTIWLILWALMWWKSTTKKVTV
ncbi:hypothetical protein Tco_1141729, partial [Tanacetum coccineum]